MCGPCRCFAHVRSDQAYVSRALQYVQELESIAGGGFSTEPSSLAQEGVAKKWLKTPPNRRRRVPPKESGAGLTDPTHKQPRRELKPVSHYASQVGGLPPRALPVREPTTPPTRLCIENAVDIWALTLGLATEEDLDHRPGTILGSFPREAMTLVLAFQRVLAKLLNAVGALVERTLAQERDGQDHKDSGGDASSLMQVGMYATNAEFAQFLTDFRSALEQMTKEARWLNSRVIWRWMDHAFTDTALGRSLGHMSGRTAQILAVVVASMESAAEEVDATMVASPVWCSAWWTRICLFVPTHPGSHKAQGLPQRPRDPDPVLFMRPLPEDSDDCHGARPGRLAGRRQTGPGA